MSVIDQTKIVTGVWNDHDREEYRQDQSHWRGVGRWADDIKWQSIGKFTFSAVMQAFQLANRRMDKNSQYTVLEWGPGGGANVFALRRIAEKYYGVDVSLKNLNEAERMIRAEGYSGFRPVHLVAEPSDCLSGEKNVVDIFVSTAVFQHFPSKDYTVQVLKVLRRLIRPGGIGLVQIRYDDGKPKFASIENIDDYASKHLTANSYRLEAFWSLLVENEFKPLAITNINANCNYATYSFSR